MLSNIKTWLSESKVEPGDILFIHGDLSVTAQFKTQNQNTVERFFNEITHYLGEDGTLVVPAFTYSFTRGQDFDVFNTKSCVGSFSEYFRNMEGVRRSHQPIFSMCSKGKYAHQISNADISDCFGKKSAFGLLHQLNAKLMNLACPFEQTFIHYVEQCQSVDYRYFKDFEGKIIDKDNHYRIKTSYFVGDQSINYKMDTRSLKSQLLKNNDLQISSLGRFAAYTVTSENFFNSCTKLLKDNKYALIEETYEY